MPTISGHVYYTPNNLLLPIAGIQNVPVVLRDPISLVGAIALTDVTGAFIFNNVPNGSYQVVEAWGTPGGNLSPVNYPAALVPMPVMPTEAEPPLSALPIAPPPLADMLMAISPNLLNITVTTNVSDLVFYDAPVGSKPISFNGLQMVGPNLVTAADNGSFGTEPAGSPVNTIPAVAPYPAATPGLPYQAIPEIADGHYSIVNIRRRVNTQFAWWNLSDHEVMLETGRFMFVNGDQPGAILFTNTINVTPNTFYTFTGWALNLLNVVGIPPRFSIRVIASDGTSLGVQLLNGLNSTPIPIWYQAGFLFNSAGYSSVTVEIVSEAPGGPGNDYAIDELRLFRTNIVDLLQLQKTMTPSTIYASSSGAGQDVTVTVTVTNTSNITAPNVFFQDIIDPQLQFVPGSVTVNGSGVGYGTANPNTGFSIGSMLPGAVNTVVFHVTTLVPGPITVMNTAQASYDAATNGNGDVIRNTVESNAASLEIVINRAIVSIAKTADKAFADVGDVLTYTLVLTNSGNVPATNIVITDAVPAGTTFIAGSLVGATGAPPTLTLISPLPAGGSVTVSYQVLVGSAIPSPNPLPNTATAAYTFTVDPAIPNGGAGTGTSNTATTLVNSAIINTVKTADPAFANVGDTITYTITVANSGNVAANNVVLTDALPAGTTFVPGSLTGATGTPPTLTLTSPVPAGGSVVVTYQVLVGAVVPNPNPVDNSAVAAFTYTVDPADPNGASGTSYSNTAGTQVNTAKLVTTKSTDKFIAYIGDTITYQIAVTNTGNAPANNVVITDPVPVGTVLVPGSMVVSVPFTTLPGGAIALTNPVAPGQTVTISFKVLVTTIPNPNPIVNVADTAYTYTVDPGQPNGESATTKTNAVTTTVFRNNYGQQVSDLIESVALEQAALAALANAEGAKIQRMAAMPGITPHQLVCLNKSVSEMLNSLTLLEAVLKQKLGLVDCQIDGQTC